MMLPSMRRVVFALLAPMFSASVLVLCVPDAVAQEAPKLKKKTERRLSSDEIEMLLQELAKKLKDAKAREKQERAAEKKALQTEVERIAEDIQFMQDSLHAVQMMLDSLNALDGEAPKQIRPTPPAARDTMRFRQPMMPPAMPRTDTMRFNQYGTRLLPNGQPMMQPTPPPMMMQPTRRDSLTQQMMMQRMMMNPDKSGAMPMQPMQPMTAPTMPMMMQPMRRDTMNPMMMRPQSAPAPVQDRYQPRERKPASELTVPPAEKLSTTGASSKRDRAKSPNTTSPDKSSPRPLSAEPVSASATTATASSSGAPTWLPLSQEHALVRTPFAEGAFLNMERTGLGMSMIGDKTFYALELMPELQTGNFAVGLDATIRVGQDGRLRPEDWQGVQALLRFIRYVRYSSDLKGLFGETDLAKNSKVFFRIGQLDNITLGDGNLVQNYRTNASYDARKVGAEFHASAERWELEGFTSNLARPEIFAARALFRDQTILSGVFKSLELSATIAADVAPEARLVAGAPSAVPALWSGASFSEGTARRQPAVGVWGAEAKVAIVKEPFFGVWAAAEYARTLQQVGPDRYGTGGAASLELRFRDVSGRWSGTAEFKTLLASDGYEPQYFNAFYEQDRFQVIGATAGGARLIDTKANRTERLGENMGGFSLKAKASYDESNNGTRRTEYGERNTENGIRAGKKFWAEASYSDAYRSAGNGLLYASVGLVNVIEQVSLTGRFYRQLAAGREVFALDDRTQIHAEASVQVSERVNLGVIYEWTFRPEFERDGFTVRRFTTQARFEPRFNFNLRF